MSTSKRLLLQPGHYAPPQRVEYPGTGEEKLFAGIYTVELGAEFRDPTFCRNRNACFRYALVNGHKVRVYAMVCADSAYRLKDRKILRDEAELNTRAIEQYITWVLHPQQKEQEREEADRQYEAALNSTDNWSVKVDQHKVAIEPIGISLELSVSSGTEYDERDAQCILIMHRLLALAQKHGLR